VKRSHQSTQLVVALAVLLSVTGVLAFAGWTFDVGEWSKTLTIPDSAPRSAFSRSVDPKFLQRDSARCKAQPRHNYRKFPRRIRVLTRFPRVLFFCSTAC